MNSSLMDEAAALESGGMRQPAAGRPAAAAAAVENCISSESIDDRSSPLFGGNLARAVDRRISRHADLPTEVEYSLRIPDTFDSGQLWVEFGR